MKRLVLVAMLAGALAACGEAAEEADDTATAEATPEATPTSFAGSYDVTMADGTAFTSVLNADGTYQDTDAEGAVTESGTWEDRDGKACFDSEAGDDTVVCYTLGDAAEDGSQVATPDDDSGPLTVKKTS